MPGAQRRSTRGGNSAHTTKTLEVPEPLLVSAGAILVTGFVALIAIVLSMSDNRFNFGGEGPHNTPDDPLDTVERWHVEPDTEIAGIAVSRNVPMVIKNSVVSKWRASRWSYTYLSKHIDTFSSLYRNDIPFFGPYFDTSRPLAHYVEPINRYERNVTMASARFLEHVKKSGESSTTGNRTRPYLYYSGEIDRLGNWALNDLLPFADLISPRPERSSINLWIGESNLTAHCHYDGYHNFFAQIKGRKRFTLIPPTSWKSVKVYPFLHPSHAQCQLNLSNIDVASVPGAQQVTLSAGDLLYLPPLWFHHVESITPSISVNFWTDSTQTDVAEVISVIQPPIQTLGRAELDAVAKPWQTLIAVGLVVNTCLDQQSPVDYIRDIVDIRYGKLLESGTLKTYDDASLTWGTNGLCSEDSNEVTRDLDTSQLYTYADKVCEHVQGLPKLTRDLWMGNYIELIAANFVGVEYVAALLGSLRDCSCGSVNICH